jgi:signal transduction histidine kinase
MDTSTVISMSANTPAPAAREACSAAIFDLSSSADALAAAAHVVSSSLQLASDVVPAAATRELAQLHARVRELAAELIEAQERTRGQLARELHDGVGAELTATRFALANVDTWLPADAPPQCVDALAAVRRSLDAVCEATRRTVADLHGPQMEAGIVGTLSQWVNEFAARTGLRTSFVCAADVRLTQLPAPASLAVFRAAQEALNNVAKHAQACAADVRLESSRRHLTLTIVDDGTGISRRAAMPCSDDQGGFGLAGMRARCAAFDGTLRIIAGAEPGLRRKASDRGDAAGAGGMNGTIGANGRRGTTVRARFAWDALLAESPSHNACHVLSS